MGKVPSPGKYESGVEDVSRACDTCAWWNEFDGYRGHGKCHRYPPVVFWKGEYREEYWPSTKGFDWCGEHRRRR